MLVIPLYVGVLILADKYDTKTLITYSMCIPTGLVIYMLAPDFWRNTTYNDLEFMIPSPIHGSLDCISLYLASKRNKDV